MEKRMFTITLEIESGCEETVVGMIDKLIRDYRTMSFEITPQDEEKKARIVYDKDVDAYKLMLSTDGGENWNFCTASNCQRGEKDKPDAEPMFVHVGLIEEIKKAIAYGFKLVQ